MTDLACRYAGDRDEALVTYLYDDGDRTSRAAFEAHLSACARCAADLAALRGVRTQLARWSPPEPNFTVTTTSSSNPESRVASSGTSRWRDIPAWAQVAAALLFLGVSAGIANLDVRYDANGLSIRTGWSASARAGDAGRAAAMQAMPTGPAGTASQVRPVSGAEAPWRDDLAALERQLKTEFHSAQAIAPAPRASNDAELLRRVRALIDESEKRQQTELALHLGQAVRDMNAKREADLIRVRGALGDVQNRLGVQVLKNSAQVQQMDYLIRTSQRQ